MKNEAISAIEALHASISQGEQATSGDRRWRGKDARQTPPIAVVREYLGGCWRTELTWVGRGSASTRGGSVVHH